MVIALRGLATDSMSTLQAPTLGDPWDWTIPQVVTALCDPNAHFRATRDPHALPDPHRLAQKLREHCIDGENLLTILDWPTLKGEFGITALGHLGHIDREIWRLRRGSPKYLDHIKQGRDGTLDIPRYTPNFGPSRYGTPSVQLPFSPQARLPLPPDTPAQSMRIATEVLHTALQLPQQIPDTEGRLRLEASIQHSQEWLNELPDQPEPVVNDVASPKSSKQHTLSRQDETSIIDKSGNKRRRLVLGIPENTLQDTLDASAINQASEQQILQMSGSPLPSIDITNQQSRKRVVPTLVPQPQEHTELVEGTRGLVPTRKPRDVYLGPKALPVDDIFYNQEISDRDQREPGSFALLDYPASIGQRRFVSSRLKHYLRQRVSMFRRGNKKCPGICPYPNRLGQKHQKLSITIFEATLDGVSVARRDRSQWLSNETSTPAQVLEHGLDTDDRVMQLALPKDNGQDWHHLEKWNYALEPSTVLPVYGESGSEGEYDLDTWREMEKENGKLAKPLGRPKQQRTVSDKESNDTIDRTIRQMTAEWKEKRLPVLSRTAWTLWTRSRRHQTTQAEIQSLEHETVHLETRLAKLRKQIADQPWTSAASVKRQCESMRRTIYGLEDSRWRIGILESEKRPVKPRKVQHKDKPESKSSTNDRLSEVGTSVDDSSEDEDLGGFIVDDDESSNSGRHGSKADVDMDQDPVTDRNNDPHPDQQPSAEDSKAKSSIPVAMKKETIPPPSTLHASQTNVVDLTLSDESESEARVDQAVSSSGNLKTPPAHTADTHVNEEPSQRSKRKRAAFKVPSCFNTDSKPGVIDLEEDSIDDSESQRQTTLELPELYETKEIYEMDPKRLMERADRKRLLIYILSHKQVQLRRDAYAYIVEHGFLKTRKAVWDIFTILRRSPSKVVETGNKPRYHIPKMITAWYICWTHAIIVNGAKKEQIELAVTEREGFESFFEFLKDVECLKDFEVSRSPTPEEQQPTIRKHPRKLAEYADDDIVATPVKKRKYAVPESQEAADIRKRAHERVGDLENRQSELKMRLKMMGKTEEDPSQVVINLGKLDNQELIYLHPAIGVKIQPHQKDGLRFLWREIVEDHASEQGCLLAQTMGLGKTMQVISFLVSVAYTAKSSNKDIREQIPPRLRKSQTIVLCPPALVENWLDEFLLWAPERIEENIGSVQIVSSAMSTGHRLQIIKDWGRDGGVLVLGFAMLRLLIDNNAPKKGSAPLNEDQHRMVKRLLLQRPNIIVADEAHFFKNQASQINHVMSQFKSGSRIALTGSPLSNNLSEYYALIDWIAPGYLGEPKEFKFHYEEPIARGLYCDSTQSELRRGLKKLELFKREVAPKVHRADISVLQSRLKGKSEFVIKVAPTGLQKRLYQVFVDFMTEHYTDSEGPSQQAKLLAWIAILRLICNHPKCFYERLTNRSTGEELHGRLTKIKEANDDQELPELSPTKLGMSGNAIRHQLEPFNGLSVPTIARVDQANKMKILLQILQLSQSAGDRVLVFTHSLPTLDYISDMLSQKNLKYSRMDGHVNPDRRQRLAKDFNQEGQSKIFLISTRAGGTGINLFAANRVVIMDDTFNPTWEEQAVGRAYRIGQTKHVFVYRLTVGGSFEDVIHNQALFKKQLATRAVDKKHIARSATRNSKDYFKPLKTVEQTDLEQYNGKDPEVLDTILAGQCG